MSNILVNAILKSCHITLCQIYSYMQVLLVSGSEESQWRKILCKILMIFEQGKIFWSSSQRKASLFILKSGLNDRTNAYPLMEINFEKMMHFCFNFISRFFFNFYYQFLWNSFCSSYIIHSRFLKWIHLIKSPYIYLIEISFILIRCTEKDTLI